MLSVVVTVYNKDAQSLTTFLEAYKQQTSTDFELVLVDDCSNVDYQHIIVQYQAHMRITYTRFGRNRGQCTARNTGIQSASGDIICVVDSDCIPNKRFVAEHLQAHTSQPWLDVVIGPYNIESAGRDIWALLQHYEQHPNQVLGDMMLQMPDNPSYFLNFITRNVSIKRAALPPTPFDPAYSYQGSNPQSGFGWEDVEAGYRLFKAGLGFGFCPKAYTIHLSHPSTTDGRLKPLRSLRNFERMLLQHPQMVHTAAADWITSTYSKILAWCQNTTPPEAFKDDTKRPWGTVIINLRATNAVAHPMVIEGVLRQWVPGVEIYLVLRDGVDRRVADYYSSLHSYVRTVQGAVAIRNGGGRYLTITVEDDQLLPPNSLRKPKHRVTTRGPKQTLGGFQDPAAYFSKDLVPLLRRTQRRIKRRLKILTYRWHCGHQYELWKLPHDFYIVEDPNLHTMAWDYQSRPLPENAQHIALDRVDPRDFDFAILHFDENCVNPAGITNSVLHESWGAIFRHMVEFTKDMPRVAICHGTPPFHGMFNVGYKGADLMQEWAVEANAVRQLVGNIPIICNSYNAWQQWHFPNSRVIWHGFDSSEYPLEEPGRGILYSANSIKHRPWYRGYHEFKWLSRRFDVAYLGRDDAGEFRRVSVEVPTEYADMRDFAIKKFNNYQSVLAQHAIFLNTTLRSPMPRSRAEAMLKGLCMVTMDYHDESRFITHGVNGFVGKSKEDLADSLKWLRKHPDQVRKIGLRGRETIRRVFPHTRYLQEWHQTIYDILGE